MILTGYGDLDEELIIADKRDHLPLKEEPVFPKHLLCSDGARTGHLLDDEINRTLLCGHFSVAYGETGEQSSTSVPSGQRTYDTICPQGLSRGSLIERAPALTARA